MRRSICAVIAAALGLLALAAQFACAAHVSQDEAKAWIRYTVPLPKSIHIAGKVVVPKGSVSVETSEDNVVVVEQGAKELREALGGRPSGQAAFTITIQTGGFDSDPLAGLKNWDQAYRIFPVGNNQLKLVGRTPTGAYYAAKTLVQLLKARSTADTVDIPLLTVTDWPDLQDRGLWGSDNFAELKWLSDIKMNYMEQISASGVDDQGVPWAKVKEQREPLVNEAHLYAMNFVPVILHLEQSSGGGIKAYPYIRGKSGHHGVLCYSQPKVPWIIAKWMVDLVSIPNVTEVDVWMSENLHGDMGCTCDLCKQTGVDPMVLEARAIVAAWRLAEKQTGRRFGLRILTSEATEAANPVILSELPQGVKVIYYHSLRTYSCDRQPQLPRYLVDWAKKGGWVATCPNLSAIVLMVQPFESAQFIRYRAQELVDSGASGLLGYATPRVHFGRYNVEAAAEYTWNLNGRSTREFAASWAVRNGIQDPEKFAEFRELIGPVEWDINGSEMVYRATHKRLKPSLAGMLKNGTLPGFGYYIDTFVKAPFGQFTGPRHLAADVEMAKKAMQLAEEIGVEEFIQEARVNQGFIRSLDELYQLQRFVKNGKIADSVKPEAARHFQTYVDSLRQSMDALPKWEATVSKMGKKTAYTNAAVGVCDELIKNMLAVAGELGVQVR